MSTTNLHTSAAAVVPSVAEVGTVVVLTSVKCSTKNFWTTTISKPIPCPKKWCITAVDASNLFTGLLARQSLLSTRELEQASWLPLQKHWRREHAYSFTSVLLRRLTSSTSIRLHVPSFPTPSRRKTNPWVLILSTVTTWTADARSKTMSLGSSQRICCRWKVDVASTKLAIVLSYRHVALKWGITTHRRRWNRCFHFQCGSITKILILWSYCRKNSAVTLISH